MAYYDITVPLSDSLAVYEGDPAVSITRSSDMAQGAAHNSSQITAGAHAGTHVDAPLHFIEDGRPVDALELGTLIGPAQVVDLEGAEHEITVGDLEEARVPGEIERLLFKTRNSSLWSKDGFQKEFVGLSTDAARWLIDRGVRLIGIDYLSMERADAEGFPVHRLLLSAGIVLLEGLDLKQVPPGAYQLICLPLRLQGAEAAPARAILVSGE